MKKILFIPCGIGLGHATRTWAIIQEVKEDTKVKVASYGTGYQFFKDKDVKLEKIKGVKYKGKKNFDLLLTLAEGLNLPFKLIESNIKLKRMIEGFDPDIVFSDSDPNGFLAANLNRRKNYMLTNLPVVLFEEKNLSEEWKKKYRRQLKMIKMLNDPMLKHGSKIFIPSIKKYKTKSSKFSVVNPITRKGAKELPEKSKLKEKLGIEEDYYLVSFPGSKMGREALEYVMKQLKGFKDKYFVILNSGKREGKTQNMYFLPFVDNSLEYLKASEGIISLAGHSTMSEAVTYQKPLLAFPIKDHLEQMVNADLLRKMGLGKAYFGELYEERVKKKLKDFFNSVPEIKTELRRLNIKGNGASQIADLLLS